MRKIRAYTMLELLVTMILSSIVIGMAYSSYQIVLKQFNNFQKKTEKVYDLTVLNKLFARDFLSSKFVTINDSQVEFSYEDKKVTYTFNDKFILVNNTDGFIDTIKVESSIISSKFLNKDQKEGSKLIDELIFVTKADDRFLKFHFLKNYDCDVILNFDNYKWQ